MSPAETSWIDELIAIQRPGYSLDQAFYQHPDIFSLDKQRVIAKHWMMAGHISQVPQPGDCFEFEIAGEHISVQRGAGQTLTACYRLAAPGAARPCHVRLFEGLILVCLAPGDAPDFSAVAEGLEPFLQLHGIADAQLAVQTHFPVAANWKLTLENYLECYHCKPAHPQYSRVEIKVEKMGDGSAAAMARYQARNEAWTQLAEKLGTLLPDFAAALPLDRSLPCAQLGAAYRAPLRAEFQSATEDGLPAAPLMGSFTDYDGGETALSLGPFTYMLASNDHAVFFQFVALDETHSNMIVSWLVNANAREHTDYDVSRLTWLWTVTTLQDKAIIEANCAGVLSRHYQPGPASLLEYDLNGFRNWYLALIGPPQALEQLKRNDKGRYFGL